MSDERDKAAEAAFEAHQEFGVWRCDNGQFKIFCGLCRLWCDADVTPYSPEPAPPGVGMMLYMADPDDPVIQLHCYLQLHVHNHECPGRAALMGS